MADFNTENPQFKKTIRKMDTSDRGNANLFNEIYQQLFDNDNVLKSELDDITAISEDEIDNIDNIELPVKPGDGTVNNITQKDIDNILAN